MARKLSVAGTSKYSAGEVDPIKKHVLQLLADGCLIVTRHHKAGFSGASRVWSKFSLLQKPDSEEFVGFVLCNDCRSVLRYDSHRTGTSSLKRHRCCPAAVREMVEEWMGQFSYWRV